MFIRRAYAYNLRPVVGGIALFCAIWALIGDPVQIGAFRSATIDKHYEANKLAAFAVVLGIMYAVVTGIESFGVLTALSQRLWMARTYAFLSVGSALVVIAAAFMRVITHFILKNELINECTDIATGKIAVYEYGFWGPVFETQLTESEANSYCKGNWNHDSSVEIILLLVEMFLALFFCTLSFAYYHQLSDPTSVANLTRRPGPAQPPPAPARDFDEGPGAGGFPAHYNPPYLGYDAPPDAPGPYGGAKPPTYSEEDVATYGGYGTGPGAKAEDPFADFDEPGKPGARRQQSEFV
ncbi:hypothetical protein FOMPIDRAFT_1032414 [Fomitopsis schrenkii]|uniref:Uncharacterized protein n=1 Tax=Fomitopsis schrenkii TaxID=2126942 RepID=S8DSZ4_FOMSC|nr:hypothetical protein FOMPIDRAFT_1032414 [Fomitopsis schrenkii]